MHTRFRLPALAALFFSGAFSAWAADAPVKGGTLIYLEQQPHTNLYPPAGGFYPNGGILNQITDKLTWQNPEPYKSNPGLPKAGALTPIKQNISLRFALASPSRMEPRLTPMRLPKTLIPTGLGIKRAACPFPK